MNGKKRLGIVFLIAAIAGALVSIYGIVQVWRARPAAERTARDTLDVTLQTLEATEAGLRVIDDLITTTSEDLVLLETTIQTLTLTIEDTGQVLDSLTTLTGSDLPATITATQTSLASAQTSAALIDDILGALTSIPLLRLGVYQPEVPLSSALGEISTSLDPLQPSLQTISASLDSTSANLDTLESDLAIVTQTTREINAALDGAGEVIGEYQEVTADLVARVERMQRVAAVNIRSIVWILTLLLLALLFPQFALAERGWQLLQEARAAPSDDEPSP